MNVVQMRGPKPPIEIPSSSRIKVPLTKKSLLYGLPRAVEVKAVFSISATRSVIGRFVRAKGGGRIWKLILAAIDAGFLMQNDICIDSSDKLPMRILFSSVTTRKGNAAQSSYFYRFDLTNYRHRAYITDVIWPVALANREAVFADPLCLQSLVLQNQRQQEAKIAAEKAANRAATLPVNEEEIIMYDKHFWPRPDGASYTYDQCRAACWYFHDADHSHALAPAYADAESRAIAIRFSTRWFAQYADREITDRDSRAKIKAVYGLVDTITSAMIAKPSGGCKLPPAPKTEGVW
jgi:hypothetical protein